MLNSLNKTTATFLFLIPCSRKRRYLFLTKPLCKNTFVKTPASWWIWIHFLKLSSPIFCVVKSFYMHININIPPLIKMKICYWSCMPSGQCSFMHKKATHSAGDGVNSAVCFGWRNMLTFVILCKINTTLSFPYLYIGTYILNIYWLQFLPSSRKQSICCRFYFSTE